MCTEVDGQKLDDSQRLRVLREIEDESKFVPSQFQPETQGQWGERMFDTGHQCGHEEAKLAAVNLITKHMKASIGDDKVEHALALLASEVLELKPL